VTATRTDTDDQRRALERYEAIAELGPAEREAALARLLAEDPALHERVTRLLAAEGAAAASSFLAAPGEASDAADGAPAAPPEADLAGRMVGPWEIEREIGTGGMGRVWLAKRGDGRYEGRVAIKLPKASFADRGLRGRFEREGRILGALAHPGIARLVDAGTLEDGQPFLVLEYVEGERIDEWCDARRLGLEDRVRLFLAVCGAVAYAHANLVVHRDLKPSNILVTPAGEVKLLDFGIAKLLDGERGDAAETELTQLAGRALTPEYAAPEQVAGAPITTATDVYSLGVVLYRLLAGRSPYQRDDGTRPSAFELQRLVVEADPQRLSSITSSRASRELAAQAAERRSTTPRKLRDALAGDLENIVARALRKSPAERYPSAQALRDDLVRHLEHRPVEARGDGAGYILARFVRRHRAAVAIGAAFVVALVAGAGGIAWQAQVARDESRRAQAEAAKSKAVSDFMAGIFRANSTDNADPAKARNTTARELLDIGARRAAKDLAGHPEAHQEVLSLIGRLYYEIGLMAEGAALDRERIAILRRLDGAGSARLAEALANLGGTLVSTGEIDEARRACTESLAVLDAIGDRASIARGEALAALANLARYRDPAQAVSLMREAATFYSEHHPATLQHANALRTLAVGLLETGRLREAEGTISTGLEVGAKVWDETTRDMAFMHQVAGLVQLALLEPAKARESFHRALAIDERALGGASPFRPVLAANLARAEQGGAGWREARDSLARTAAGLDPAKPAERRTWAFVRANLAQALFREGDLAGARAALDPAWPVIREAIPKPLAGALVAMAMEIESLERRDAVAAKYREELEALRTGALATNAAALARADEAEARRLVERGEADAARRVLTSRLDALAAGPAEAQPLERAPLRLLLAEAEEKAGYPDEAARIAREVLAKVEARADREWVADLEATAALRAGSAALATGNRDEALPLLERAARLREARQHPGSPFLREARDRLAAARTGR